MVASFDIGAHYDSAKIKAQIKAVYDGGGTGWLLWDPNNRYADVKKALESCLYYYAPHQISNRDLL